MLGILASTFRTATRTERREAGESHSARRDRLRHEDARRRERDALDHEIRFRRGYW